MTTRPQTNLATLSTTELKALEQMRVIFANETYPDQQDPTSWFQLEDWTYIRYLKARKFDVPKAEKMLKDTLEMRRKFTPHLLDANEPALRAVLNLKFWRLLPCSKSHAAVQLTEVGVFDAALVENEEDFARYLVLCVELGCRQLALNGWKSQSLVAIFDFHNFSLMKQANAKAMRLIKMLVETNDLNYPEMLEKAILFNAPFLFKAPYKVIRPWIAKETQDKIIFVTDTAELDALMDKETRMERHGGTRKEEYPSIFYEK